MEVPDRHAWPLCSGLGTSISPMPAHFKVQPAQAMPDAQLTNRVGPDQVAALRLHAAPDSRFLWPAEGKGGGPCHG